MSGSLPDYHGCAVLLLAAGEGRRFGGPKTGARLMGMTLLERSAIAFEALPQKVAVIRPGTEIPELRGWRIVPGGDRRRDSVAAGLRALEPGTEIVLVHDAARPLVDKELVARVAAATRERGAVVPVVPVTDTIKRIDGDRIAATPDRATLVAAQTPQGFRVGLLSRALAANSSDSTDDASLVEALGETVATVPGDPKNLKITRRADLDLAEAHLRADMSEI